MNNKVRSYFPMPIQVPTRNIFPSWVSNNALIVYLIVFFGVSMLYSSYSVPWYYMISGFVAVSVFFMGGASLIKDMSEYRIKKAKSYEKRIFMVALLPRVVFTVLIYWLFMTNYGDAFGFECGDATLYEELGGDLADMLKNGKSFSAWRDTNRDVDISDIGYAAYMGIVYWLTGKSILAVRIMKCIWSSFTVVLIYRLAKRNFGEQTGRMAALFCALWFNLWYYCTCHLKEVEMVFLGVLFVEQADQMLRSRQFTLWKVIPILLIAAALFTIRTPLALVALLSLVFSVVMSSSKVVNWGKRIIVGGLAVLLIAVTMGNRLYEEAHGLMDTVQSGQQRSNMEWRTRRLDGNKFAKYAGAAVFAPMIFTLPFPTMVRPYEGQEVQQLNNGGNFVKNIMSFFTILAMVILLITGRWREHLLPLSFMLGYLVVLSMSNFAQSERFHQPAMPFELMFAAYGLSIAVTKPKYKRWFTYWCALMFVAAFAWNWFKLAGRGLT